MKRTVFKPPHLPKSIVYVVQDIASGCAVTLEVSSGWRYFQWHAPFPLDVDTVKEGYRGQACTWTEGGRCFADGCSIDDPPSEFELAPEPADEQPERFWIALEKRAMEKIEKLKKSAAAFTHEQCGHCHGAGVVERKR